jgi:hypothetical protein
LGGVLKTARRKNLTCFVNGMQDEITTWRYEINPLITRAKLKYMRAIATNQNCIHEEGNTRLPSGNAAWCHSAQQLTVCCQTCFEGGAEAESVWE